MSGETQRRDDTSRILYRMTYLPRQLERARMKVTHLEREAQRLGMTELLERRP